MQKWCETKRLELSQVNCIHALLPFIAIISHSVMFTFNVMRWRSVSISTSLLYIYIQSNLLLKKQITEFDNPSVEELEHIRMYRMDEDLKIKFTLAQYEKSLL